jgi:hypothetical protein
MNMRDILQAKIASLEELASALKGLSEMKERIAEDRECPSADPERFRQKALEDGVSETFVVATLNGILSEVAPQPPYVSPHRAAHPSMAGQLGQLVSWGANVIALAIVAMFLLIAINDVHNSDALVLIGIAIAVVVWMVGLGLRYVLERHTGTRSRHFANCE